MKNHFDEGHMRGSKEPRAVPAPDANAELARSIQVLMWGLIVLVSMLMHVYMKSDPKGQINQIVTILQFFLF